MGDAKMTDVELRQVLESPSSAIIAPAGHGKTEMIADLVAHSEGRQLLLTHTNVGVDALRKRLVKKGVAKNAYTITTIAAFCIKWCMSYPGTAHFDKSLSPFTDAKEYYARLYDGTKKIFKMSWSGTILRATYTGIIVDEYQDCIQAQHEIMLEINQYLPIRVLGDPMQGIFEFAGRIVDWRHLEFPVVDMKTKPWRWQDSNPELGDYLMDVRKTLEPILSGKECTLIVEDNNPNVEVVAPDFLLNYRFLERLKPYSTTTYIARWPRQQLSICSRMAGIFQYDEKQDCDDLFHSADVFDKNEGAALALSVIEFANLCSNKVNAELASYKKKLCAGSLDFSRIRKYTGLKDILLQLDNMNKEKFIADMLDWFSATSVFKQYRVELFSEMRRSVKYAAEHGMTIFEAASHIRKDASLQKRYSGFRFLSSRTVLSKGLEFDCVIIDMTDPLPAKDFYVAMTRAMRKIYIVADTNKFSFK